MPFSVATLSQLISSGVTDIETELDEVLPKFGIEQALNIAVSAAVRDLYDYQTWIVRQIIPTTESEDQTILDTARYEGIIQKLASKAKGSATATGSSPIPLGTQLTHKDGRLYEVTFSDEPSGDQVEFTIQALDAGVDGNLISGETLTFTSPVSGIAATCTTEDISGGADVEPVSQVLERLLFRKRNPPMGGAVHDYVAWCREVSGVTRAWAYDLYQGGSTVGYAFVFDDRADIIPNAQDIQSMDDYIYRHEDPATGADVGRPAGIEVINVGLTLKETALSIKLIPDSSELRAEVLTGLDAYFKTLSPGETLLLSGVRTAIGSTDGVEDYQLSLTNNVTAAQNELHALGAVTWLTE